MINLATIIGEDDEILTLAYNRAGNTLDVLDEYSLEVCKLAEGGQFANLKAAKDFIQASYAAKIWGLIWL